MGLADQILAASDIETEPYDVPEWGLKVWVRALTGTDRDAYEGSVRQVRPRLDGKGMEVVMLDDNTRAKLLVKCLVDETGERIFTDRQVGDLGGKNGRVIDRLYDVATRLSGMSDEAVEGAKGNSDAAPSGASPSISPESSALPSPSS